MDKKALVDRDIKAGEELIGKLDEKGFPFNAALWYFDPDAEDWRFIIATDLVQTLGPHKTYERLHPYLAPFRDESELTPMNVTAVTPTDDLSRLLASVIQTGPGPGVSHIRFTGNVVNGTFIEDAYIYRLRLPAAGKSRTRTRIRKGNHATRKSRVG